MLVVRVSNPGAMFPDNHEYPSECSVVSTDPTWLKVVDIDKQIVALHKVSLVISAFRVEDELENVPTDTRLNHTTLRRDKLGRFVGKA